MSLALILSFFNFSVIRLSVQDLLVLEDEKTFSDRGSGFVVVQ